MPDSASPTETQSARAQWLTGGDAPGVRHLQLAGNWTVQGLDPAPRLQLPSGCKTLRLSASDWQLDTAGALVLARSLQAWIEAGVEIDRAGLAAPQNQLLDLVRERMAQAPRRPPRAHAGLLGDLGRAGVAAWREGREFLAFVGELGWRGLPLLARFWRIRWREVVAEIDAAGIRALGIIGLLSFLIGMVMAYQGGATLATYGANILIVNLVAIITLRELGPLLAAILVAGRTGSSYTAQLGTMRITEEIDALRALGLSPFDVLVFPKVLALVITLPLLSLFADVMGLAGGGVVASMGYGVPWSEYISRIPQVVTAQTLALGLVKAPVFAAIIALVGCMQGMRVSGSAAAVGRATTVSVVQAIFLVIVIDAGFSILYNLLGL
ncbi:putative phospholipid ABC transporter permease protein MlaE [mine drainage metagenome]|uniref:Putative phospholipid ABC transporter permease protein MlaE n=1 Tax=mine drainage metagenome TaxID=410659 RepID=A0A1J5SEU6_9ZZZZ